MFGTQPGYRFRYSRNQVDGRLELAYGIIASSLMAYVGKLTARPSFEKTAPPPRK